MRLLKYLILPLVVFLAACTAKDTMVTTPVDISFKIDRIKSGKVYLTVTCPNPDAYYFCKVRYLDPEAPAKSDREMALENIELAKLNYKVRKENMDIHARLIDLSAYRGSRSIKNTELASGHTYRVLLFQVNPEDLSIIGEVKGQTFQTPRVEMKDVDFSFSAEGNRLLVTPSDDECTYYWDFESEERIYDDYMSPEGYFYGVVDMYEDYGFMGNVLLRGPAQYDLSKTQLREGETYLVIAAAYDMQQEEITSRCIVSEFTYQGGQLRMLEYD